MSEVIVVVPTSRGVNLTYLQPLIKAGARFIIVNDSDESLVTDHPQFSVYSLADRRRILGPLEKAIPHRTGACRDFGLLLACCEAAADDTIIALDDDCRVLGDFQEALLSSCLRSTPRPIVCGSSQHFNILDLYRDPPNGMFPRGFPYSERIDYNPWRLDGLTVQQPSFNLGMWRNVFDVNAIDKLAGVEYVYPSARLQQPSVALPPGAFVSVCSMNMQMLPAVIPAAYQFPMHIPVLSGHVIDRFGDIWGGFVLKRLMDINGDLMSVGEPLVDHLKEGPWEKNAQQEHLAHLVNDEFIALLLSATSAFKADTYLNNVMFLTEELSRAADAASPILRRYLETLLPCLEAWTKALSKLAPTANAKHCISSMQA